MPDILTDGRYMDETQESRSISQPYLVQRLWCTIQETTVKPFLCAVQSQSSNHKLIASRYCFWGFQRCCWCGPRKLDLSPLVLETGVPWEIGFGQGLGLYSSLQSRALFGFGKLSHKDSTCFLTSLFSSFFLSSWRPLNHKRHGPSVFGPRLFEGWAIVAGP